MCTEVEDGIGLEDLFQVGVVGSETVVRTGGLGEKQPHGVTLVPERRLDTDEDISKLLPVNDQVLAIGVKVSRRRAPVFFQILCVRGKFVVFLSGHAVLDVQFGGVDTSFRVVQDTFHDLLLGVGGISDVIPF